MFQMSLLTQLTACRERSSGGWSLPYVIWSKIQIQSTLSQLSTWLWLVLVLFSTALAPHKGLRVRNCSRVSLKQVETPYTLSAQENTVPHKLGGRAGSITGRLEITEQASMLESRESLSWQQWELLNSITCTGNVKLGSILSLLLSAGRNWQDCSSECWFIFNNSF